VIEACVDYDTVKPGGEFGVSFKFRGISPDFQKYFLGSIFCFPAIVLKVIDKI
jgi:hypothetical protein